MSSPANRRSRPRIVTQVPVRVRQDGGTTEQTAQTRDISINGVFLYTSSPLTPGSELELVLMLPSALTAGEKCWVCCQARVVRVEQRPGADCGVAAEIQRMDLLPEIAL